MENRVFRVKSLIYDKLNPERAFDTGEYITVEDQERLKTLLDGNLVDEVKDVPKGAIVKELVLKITEVEKSSTPVKSATKASTKKK